MTGEGGSAGGMAGGSAGDGGLDIRNGGVVAVDTESIRSAAAVLAVLAARVDELHCEVDAITVELADHPETWWAPAELSSALGRRLADMRAAASDLERGLRKVADAYEIVEVDAARAAAGAAGELELSRALGRRVDDLRERMPGAAALAGELMAAWQRGRHAELRGQVAEAGRPLGWLGVFVNLLVGAGLGTLGTLGHGRVQPSDRLTGRAAPVMAAGSPAPAAEPPATLAALAARVPQGDDQVRVERYRQPDGSDRFVVYVAGTRAPTGFGGPEPLDMTSNLQLYTGERSASYDAVVAALRDAGAGEGDAVVAVGHSQGAAITSRLALEGEFDVQANVTFGSPVQADLGPGILNVTVRHSDDPVAALSAGGHPGAAGSPGSLVVERAADPEGKLSDLALGAHDMTAYVTTARLTDAAEDPRLAGARDLVAGFAGSAPAVVTTYRLRREA